MEVKPMIESLLKNCLFTKTSVAAVAATDDITNGSIIDLGSGTEGQFDSVCFVAILGEVTNAAVVTLKAYCGNASNLAGGAYKATTATVTASGNDTDNNLLILDVVQPGTRYVRGDLVRDTQNSVVDSIIAIRYNAKNVPTTQTADVADGDVSVN
jgi:hypothetical protein